MHGRVVPLHPQPATPQVRSSALIIGQTQPADLCTGAKTTTGSNGSDPSVRQGTGMPEDSINPQVRFSASMRVSIRLLISIFCRTLTRSEAALLTKAMEIPPRYLYVFTLCVLVRHLSDPITRMFS